MLDKVLAAAPARRDDFHREHALAYVSSCIATAILHLVIWERRKHLLVPPRFDASFTAALATRATAANFFVCYTAQRLIP